MLSITCLNVNDAFPIGLHYLNTCGVSRDSRNGPVLEYPDPVSIKYQRPTERVLFDRARAINPFLHFFEPLWILAGQADVAFLARIVGRFNEYSDNGVTFFGAYGFRMRHVPSEHGWVDQIEEAVRALRTNPDDRRVVLQIRRPEDIVYRGKDQPCNLSVALKIRDGKLNIHVFNRSNDFIWGMTGANMPQFSTLQEYLAGRIGVEVGVYHQTTDSMHVYVENPQFERLKNVGLYNEVPSDLYTYAGVKPYPLHQPGEDVTLFDDDLKEFFGPASVREGFKSAYFNNVVAPMWRTFVAHKAHCSGLDHVSDVAAEDWREVTIQWLEDRE